MDSARIVGPQGQDFGRHDFVRAPFDGEWVAVERKWAQVTSVVHEWPVAAIPTLAVHVGPLRDKPSNML